MCYALSGYIYIGFGMFGGDQLKIESKRDDTSDMKGCNIYGADVTTQSCGDISQVCFVHRLFLGTDNQPYEHFLITTSDVRMKY